MTSQQSNRHQRQLSQVPSFRRVVRLTVARLSNPLWRGIQAITRLRKLSCLVRLKKYIHSALQSSVLGCGESVSRHELGSSVGSKISSPWCAVLSCGAHLDSAAKPLQYTSCDRQGKCRNSKDKQRRPDILVVVSAQMSSVDCSLDRFCAT